MKLPLLPLNACTISALLAKKSLSTVQLVGEITSVVAVQGYFEVPENFRAIPFIGMT